MKLRDRFYFRFGLYHKAHLARLFAAFAEGLAIGTILLGFLLTLYFAGKFLWWIVSAEIERERHEAAQHEKAERVKVEAILVGCLNTGHVIVDGRLRSCG